MTAPGTEPHIDGIVFAHDNAFLEADDGTYYSSRGHWPWDRYLAFASHVTVVSRQERLPTGTSTEELERSSRDGVSFVEIPSLSSPLARVALRRRARSTIGSVLRDHDAVIARLPSEIGAVAIQAARDLGKPYAVELVTCTWDALWNYGSWQAKAYAPVSMWETRRLVRGAPHVFYVTSEFLQGRYPTAGHQIGVSDVELDHLTEDILRRRLARIESRTEPVVLGLIGYLNVRFKGIHVALEAISRVRDSIPKVTFRVLGSGDPAEMATLAKDLGVADLVHFDGTLPAGRVLGWLDDIDIYLQPSFQEGLPRSLVEAMSRACPALGSTAGGIPELLDESALHKPGDAATLAKHLRRAVTDVDWQRQSAAANFDVARGFERSVLDARRERFWNDFATAVAREKAH